MSSSNLPASLLGLAVGALCLAPLVPPAVGSPGESGQLEVGVTLAGDESENEVVDGHRPIFVMVFGGPAMGAPGSPLIAVGRIDRNAGAARFEGLPETVWLAAIHDPSGTFTGLSGVIPGSLVGGYAEDGATEASGVETGPGARVEIQLDEQTRLPGSADVERAEALHSAQRGIVELRTYTIREGMRDTFVEFFEQKTLEHQRRTGLDVVGQFRSLEDENTFVWIRTFESEQQRIDQLRDFYLGDDWMAVQDEAMSLIVDTNEVLMEPTELSTWR